MSKLTLVIKNIKDPKSIGSGGIQNQFKGRYAKIFDILNEDSIFMQIEASDEKLIGNDLYIYFDTIPEESKLQKIRNMKGVDVVENDIFLTGGQIDGFSYSIGGL